MDRKTFIRKTSAGILIGIPTVTLLSCSSSDDNSNPSTDDDQGSNGPNCLENGTAISISSNHGHSLSVSKEDVAAGTQKTYTLSQGDGHIHEVIISESQFEILQGNNQITAISTSDAGHTHNVRVSCA